MPSLEKIGLLYLKTHDNLNPQFTEYFKVNFFFATRANVYLAHNLIKILSYSFEYYMKYKYPTAYNTQLQHIRPCDRDFSCGYLRYALYEVQVL